jgi:pimeloyl-ACP methyl ester carboxylesterase
VTEDVWQGYLRPLHLRGTATSLQKLAGDIGHDAPLDPATVGRRTLLLWGDSDPVVPLRVAHRFHATMPDARLEVIPRAGHLVLEEQPDLCNRSLSAFLGAPLPVTMPSPVRS